MNDVYFFDVPIYRLPEAKYNSDRDTFIERSMADLCHEDWPIADQLHNKLWKEYGGAWQFSEIIGYIRLYSCGNQIRGELWMTNVKRIVQTRRKQFAWTTWKVVPEKSFPETASNLEMYMAILEYLRSAERQYKGSFIDTEMFASVGKYTETRYCRIAGKDPPDDLVDLTAMKRQTSRNFTFSGKAAWPIVRSRS